MAKKKRVLPGQDVRLADAWGYLQPGDRVEIVAPGFSVPSRTLQRAKKYIRSLGLVPRVQSGILSKHHLCASSDATRLRHLKRALNAKDSQAIWCLRGGYGMIRLLPQLNRLRKPSHSKLVLGYSDITTLHGFLNHFWQWPTLHSPILDRLANGRSPLSEEQELLEIIFGEATEITFDNLRPLNAAARRKRNVRSSVVGGNLTVLQSSLGTPWQVNPQGKILFLEDIAEPDYKVDRIFHHFEQAGFLKGVRAIVLGDFVWTDPKLKKAVWNVIGYWARDQKIPVLKGMKAGHGSHQRVVPLFTKAFLSLGRNPELVIQTGGRRQ